MNVDFGSDDNYVGDKPGLGVRLCPESCRWSMVTVKGDPKREIRTHTVDVRHAGSPVTVVTGFWELYTSVSQVPFHANL